MGTVYRKGKMLWIGFKRGDEWVYQSSGLGVGHEAKARKLLEKIEAKIEAGEELEKASGVDVHVLAHYADVWIEKREAFGLADWKSDRARLRDHVLPVLGEKRLDEVRPRHLKDLFLKLRTAGKLAPKTIHHVYTVTKALFRDAVLDELVETSPCILGKYELGKVQDKDPEWRSTAVYTRAELEALIADERIPYDRRVLYALEGLAGLRHGEAAGLRWRHVDLALEPLGCLLIATSYDKGRTKTGAPRRVPIHPTLAAILAEWKLGGWAAMMQRNAGADDIVVPLPLDEGQVGGVPNPRAGRMRNKSDSWKRLAKDFAALELRPRRGHDLRRTFISLARQDGARRDLLEVVTHNPRVAGAIDLYTSYDWPSLCAEVGKLKVSRAARGQVIPLPRAAIARGSSSELTPGLTPEGDKTLQSLGKKGGGAGNRILRRGR